MSHLSSYLSQISQKPSEVTASIEKSVNQLWSEHLAKFNYNEHIAGLVFGQVQSGKTSHVLGIMAKAADEGFKAFILLTTDNVSLQKQTLERSLNTLDTFNICDETDDMRFRAGTLRKPSVLVLKKNQSVLKTWIGHLGTTSLWKEQPLFMIDDEGDASSLNTLINKNEQSTINSLINELRLISPSSIFLSVTATPQALILQTKDSDMRPKFAHLINPGKSYLGGEFFYSESSRCPRTISETERRELFTNNNITPEGLRKAILSFMVTSVYRQIMGKEVTNLLIHPSARISDHQIVESKVKTYIAGVLKDLKNDSPNFKMAVLDAWNDLKSTEQGLLPFDQCYSSLEKCAENIRILVINSNSAYTDDYSKGVNIIIGGNSLGRGLTFPGLHTTYYLRTARTPQADTSWQHSRMFGYDRMPGLCRVYAPPSLIHLFRELNEANESMVKILKEKGIDSISLLNPVGTRPTRKNVIKTPSQVIIMGGVNYFPQWPKTSKLAELDKILGDKDKVISINLDEAIRIISLIESDASDSFQKKWFVEAIQALSRSNYKSGCQLIVRTNRSITSGTGTLLSPNDRALSDSFIDRLALTLYRLNGEKEKGWEGAPLWVPNVKLPTGTNYQSSK